MYFVGEATSGYESSYTETLMRHIRERRRRIPRLGSRRYLLRLQGQCTSPHLARPHASARAGIYSLLIGCHVISDKLNHA